MRGSPRSKSFLSSHHLSGGILPSGNAHVRERTHDMPIGTVKFFNADKGYGFIAAEDGSGDSFVHITAVERSGMAGLDRDQRVSYDLEEDRRGKMSAVNLKQA
jgi:CspA family cold shock protein